MRRFFTFQRSADQRGTTVLEMVVVTALLMLVVGSAFGAVSSMQKNTQSTTDRFTAIGEAQTMMDRLSKDLRAAVTTSAGGAPFTIADQNSVEFYADLGQLYNDPVAGMQPGPTKLTVYLTNLSGSNVKLLHEDATPPASGTIGNFTFGTTATNRIDGKYLDTAVPMFTYYQYDGTDPSNPGKLAAITIPSGGITDVGTLQNIVAIGITIRVRVTPTSPVAQINTLVHVRNVDYNPD
jgi:hypothetical protein